MFAPSQWETALQSNAVSHWLGANLESALQYTMIWQAAQQWQMIKFWTHEIHPISPPQVWTVLRCLQTITRASKFFKFQWRIQFDQLFTLFPKNYAQGLCFMICCGLVMVKFTHILQAYFTSPGTIIWLPGNHMYDCLAIICCPRAVEATLTNMGKCIPSTHNNWNLNHNKMKQENVHILWSVLILTSHGILHNLTINEKPLPITGPYEWRILIGSPHKGSVTRKYFSWVILWSHLVSYTLCGYVKPYHWLAWKIFPYYWPAIYVENPARILHTKNQ